MEGGLPHFAPRRELGRTGFRATILGIGDVADRNVPLEECLATVRRAMEAGLNVIDTAPGYENGYSEEIVGKALAGRREGMFVIDKIDHAEEAVGPQVEGSLERLGMDHTDAFVFHGVSTRALWEKVRGGPMEELGACVRAGKTRFRGVSSHHPEVVQIAIESGVCDIVMFAVGPACDRRYIEEMLPLARERGVGTVCFKTFGAGKLVADTAGYGRELSERAQARIAAAAGKDEGSRRRAGALCRAAGGQKDESGKGGGGAVLPRLSPEECVRYTLTCDPDVALLGLSFPNEQDPAFAAAADFAPLSAEELADVRRRAAEAIRDKGACWWDPP